MSTIVNDEILCHGYIGGYFDNNVEVLWFSTFFFSNAIIKCATLEEIEAEKTLIEKNAVSK